MRVWLLYISIFLSVFVALPAQAGLFGSDYYTAQTDVTLAVNKGQNGPSENVTIPAKSFVSFKRDLLDPFAAYIEVERGDRTDRIRITNKELQRYFLGPQSTSNPQSDPTDKLYVHPDTADKNAFFRMDQNPQNLGGPLEAARHKENTYDLGDKDPTAFEQFIPMADLVPDKNTHGVDIQLKESKIVNFGTPAQPQWAMVHHVEVKILGRDSQSGWVRGDQINSEGYPPPSANLTPDYERPVNGPQMSCPNANLTPFLRHAATAIENKARARTAQERADALAIVEDKLGTCLVDPEESNQKFEKDFKRYKDGTILYDKIALKKMSSLFPKSKKNAPNRLIKEDGQPLNAHDFIAMDALARTLFSEMESCETKTEDAHIMEAAAKTILNRAEVAGDRGAFSDFLRGKHDPWLNSSVREYRYPDQIAKAATASHQYSLWNTLDFATDQREQISNLKRAFCPRSRDSNPAVAMAWKHAVTTAMWAIMNPKDFKAYTANVKAFDYTSNVKRDRKDYRRESNPMVGGEVIDVPKCLMFWDEKKRPAAKALAKEALTEKATAKEALAEKRRQDD